eukprot:m.121207 g.121207  ORF g.121207 m.121207 type:complete len:64 (-) comp11076_c0_seq3:1232-1423(-)
MVVIVTASVVVCTGGTAAAAAPAAAETTATVAEFGMYMFRDILLPRIRMAAHVYTQSLPNYLS